MLWLISGMCIYQPEPINSDCTFTWLGIFLGKLRSGQTVGLIISAIFFICHQGLLVQWKKLSPKQRWQLYQILTTLINRNIYLQSDLFGSVLGALHQPFPPMIELLCIFHFYGHFHSTCTSHCVEEVLVFQGSSQARNNSCVSSTENGEDSK
mmetsp:Transcript_29297/g.41250  ORF Transcript_29297/g.41250 Transcript_29297/m.41250 type:complete len:152 (-) Transcript_29297:366-821(-)